MMNDDIVKRLREVPPTPRYDDTYFIYVYRLGLLAADEIERLRTKNARLREALRVIAKHDLQGVALDALHPNTDRKR